MPFSSAYTAPSATCTDCTPANAPSTAAARSGASTVNVAAPRPAMMFSTVPSATTLPWCMTTTCVQVCSTSASRWLDTTTVRPPAA